MIAIWVHVREPRSAGIVVKQSAVDLVPAFALAGTTDDLVLMALAVIRPALWSRVHPAAGAT